MMLGKLDTHMQTNEKEAESYIIQKSQFKVDEWINIISEIIKLTRYKLWHKLLQWFFGYKNKFQVTKARINNCSSWLIIRNGKSHTY